MRAHIGISTSFCRGTINFAALRWPAIACFLRCPEFWIPSGRAGAGKYWDTGLRFFRKELGNPRKFGSSVSPVLSPDMRGAVRFAWETSMRCAGAYRGLLSEFRQQVAGDGARNFAALCFRLHSHLFRRGVSPHSPGSKIAGTTLASQGRHLLGRHSTKSACSGENCGIWGTCVIRLVRLAIVSPLAWGTDRFAW